jgi:hypothetical protein
MRPEECRRLWAATEPYHAVVYFAPEIPEASTRLGLQGFWMSYFAGRAAPMGPVAAPVVAATYFNFAPRMVERAIPDAWQAAPPAAVVEDRIESVGRALERLLGSGVAEPEVAEAAALASAAADAADPAGRPLAAAWQRVARPGEAHLDLWLALTVLREHRGDGHVARLTAAGIDGCQAHVLLVAAGRTTRETQQRARGWTDEEWDQAQAGLVARGWLDGRGTITAAGQATYVEVEHDTDWLAEGPWRALDDDQRDRLLDITGRLRARLLGQGLIPFPNPMGLPADG